MFGFLKYHALANFSLFDLMTGIGDYLKELLDKISDLKISELVGIDHLTDYIDFFLLTVCIFCALRYMRRRRAGKMLIGITVLLIVYLLCDLLSLHTMAFVLQSIYRGGVLVIVVLFSQEIKRGLEKLGTFPEFIIGAKYHRGGKDTHIDRLMDALTAISLSGKMGALVVIEGYTKLDDHIDTRKGHNTIVNADITTELIKTIFMNGTELHDGGLIIRRGRIHAASCYFPSTKNLEYVNHINSMTGHPLGSRHQAAIGLSEECDAVIIVVSEETHAMSVAYLGEIYIDLSTDQMSTVVKAAMTGSRKDLNRAFNQLKATKVH